MRTLNADVLLGPFPARVLGGYRIVVGLAGIVMAISTGRTLLRLALPDTVQVPVLALAPPVGSSSALGLALVWVVASALLAIGAWTRIAAGTAVLAAVLAMLWDAQVTSNHLTLFVLLTTLLGVARSGAAVSFDARVGRGAATVPFWPVLLVQTQITTMYFFTALAKSNPEFLGGDVLEQQVPLAAALADTAGSWILPAMAVTTVAIELLLAVGLWFRRTRLLAASAGLVLHVGILVTSPDSLAALLPFGAMALGSYPLFFAPALRTSPSD